MLNLFLVDVGFPYNLLRMKIRLLGHDFFYAFTVLRVHKSIIK